MAGLQSGPPWPSVEVARWAAPESGTAGHPQLQSTLPKRSGPHTPAACVPGGYVGLIQHIKWCCWALVALVIVKITLEHLIPRYPPIVRYSSPAPAPAPTHHANSPPASLLPPQPHPFPPVPRCFPTNPNLPFSCLYKLSEV